jgi:hypothetical protein
MRGACFLAVIALAHAAGQSLALKEPYGPQHALVSPNGAYALFGIQSTVNAENALWLEDRRTHERRMVLAATVQTLTLAWSPDSAAFAVNDRALSDIENAYIFDAKTLERLDLAARITAAAGPEAARFLKGRKDHSYFHVKRWLDARHVEVALYGHTVALLNGTAVEGGDCFELRYRVSRDGEVEKLGQKVAPLGAKVCGAIESAQD